MLSVFQNRAAWVRCSSPRWPAGGAVGLQGSLTVCCWGPTEQPSTRPPLHLAAEGKHQQERTVITFKELLNEKVLSRRSKNRNIPPVWSLFLPQNLSGFCPDGLGRLVDQHRWARPVVKTVKGQKWRREREENSVSLSCSLFLTLGQNRSINWLRVSVPVIGLIKMKCYT